MILRDGASGQNDDRNDYHDHDDDDDDETMTMTFLIIIHIIIIINYLMLIMTLLMITIIPATPPRKKMPTSLRVGARPCPSPTAYKALNNQQQPLDQP